MTMGLLPGFVSNAGYHRSKTIPVYSIRMSNWGRTSWLGSLTGGQNGIAPKIFWSLSARTFNTPMQTWISRYVLIY